MHHAVCSDDQRAKHAGGAGRRECGRREPGENPPAFMGEHENQREQKTVSRLAICGRPIERVGCRNGHQREKRCVARADLARVSGVDDWGGCAEQKVREHHAGMCGRQAGDRPNALRKERKEREESPVFCSRTGCRRDGRIAVDRDVAIPAAIPLAQLGEQTAINLRAASQNGGEGEPRQAAATRKQRQGQQRSGSRERMSARTRHDNGPRSFPRNAIGKRRAIRA